MKSPNQTLTTGNRLALATAGLVLAGGALSACGADNETAPTPKPPETVTQIAAGCALELTDVLGSAASPTYVDTDGKGYISVGNKSENKPDGMTETQLSYDPIKGKFYVLAATDRGVGKDENSLFMTFVAKDDKAINSLADLRNQFASPDSIELESAEVTTFEGGLGADVAAPGNMIEYVLEDGRGSMLTNFDKTTEQAVTPEVVVRQCSLVTQDPTV